MENAKDNDNVIVLNDLPEIEVSSSTSEDDDDEEEEDRKNYIPYSSRPEWADVQPVPQNDGPYSVVAINYNARYEETFNYFRAILANNEMSLRAFNLTTDCIKLNPGNYSVWHLRRILLAELNIPLDDELEYIEKVIEKNQKNYQVWEHYKCIIKKLKQQQPDYDQDKLVTRVKTFIRSILSEDSKNYHAWQHLQWFIEELNRFDSELDYTDNLIHEDIRNNSAWNHRFYVISHTTGFTAKVIDAEYERTFSLIDKAPHNESAWNFLMGLVNQAPKKFDSFKDLSTKCQTLVQQKGEPLSPFLLSFMVAHLNHQLQTLLEAGLEDKSNQDAFKETFEKAIELCDQLANQWDAIREVYWKHQACVLKQKYQLLV